MRHKNLWLLFGLLFIVSFFSVFFFKDKMTAKTVEEYSQMSDLNTMYPITSEIEKARGFLTTDPEAASVITNQVDGKRQIALTFDGMADEKTMEKILDLLRKYKVQATFFVEGINAADHPKVITAIENAGHRIGNYTWIGLSQVEKLTQEQMLIDFSRTQKVIKVTTDQMPTLLKASKTVYTPILLQTAKACGIESVVKNGVFLPKNQLHSLEEANAFLHTLKPGSIVSVQLGTPVDVYTYEAEKSSDTAAVDKQPSVKDPNSQMNLKDEEITDEIERFLIALQVQKYEVTLVEDFPKVQYVPSAKKTAWVHLMHEIKTQVVSLFSIQTAYAASNDTIENLRLKNDGKFAEEMKIIPTTEQAIIYTFGGLAKENVVEDVLERLDKKQIKATFFILEREMQQYPEVVQKMIARGHEIGIAVRPKDNADFTQIVNEISSARKMLKDRFGVETNLVKQPWGVVRDETKEAVAALECQLIGQSVNVVQSKHKDAQSADQVMEEIFGKSVYSLSRGQIVHFRMDYYTKDALIGDMLDMIKVRKIDNIAYTALDDDPAYNLQNDSTYKIASVGSVLANKKMLYAYPVDLERVPLELRPENHEVHINEENFKEEIAKRYIGSPEVDADDRMLGFSQREMRRLDLSGTIRTDENVIFFTFDDWGTDAAVNKLLYVLRKHEVPGNFFVITHNVLNNTNLLRAIAMEGHEIGSHSNLHKAMVVRDKKTGKQVQPQTREEYREDLTTSYQRLASVVGDVEVNGKYALTRYFRPPTLAVSKMGFETLFDTGYTYIVSGSRSTEDYAAENLSDLVDSIQDGIYDQNGHVKKGAVLVMHMSDYAKYTAHALDLILTANEAKADGDPTKFKVGRLADYIKDDYTQARHKVN